jgi:hypothetical protein
MSGAVEEPPHFVVAVVVASLCLFLLILKGTVVFA